MFSSRRSASKKIKNMKPLIACALFSLEDPCPKPSAPAPEEDESILSSPRSPMAPNVPSIHADFGELVKPTPFKTFSTKSFTTLSSPTTGSTLSPSPRDCCDSATMPFSFSVIDRKKSSESEELPSKKSILKTAGRSRFSRGQSERTFQTRKVSLQCELYKSSPQIDNKSGGL